MTTSSASEDTLIRDSQLGGFASFKERIGSCFCRVFRKSSSYNLSSASKDIQDEVDKPSYINQAIQLEKQARKDKLDKIARTLPGATPNGRQETRAPISIMQTPTRSLTTKTQETPRSAITLTQARQPKGTPISKTGISTINKPSPSAANKKSTDETNTDDSGEEESSSEDDKSSDSDSAPVKQPQAKSANKRR